MSMEMNKARVEQAGGDERAAFEVWASALGWKLSPDQNNCGIVVAERYGHPGVQRCWEAWQARAALAQPSPAPELERPATFSVPSCENSYGFGYVDGTCIQSLRGYRDHLETIVDALPEGELMTVAQHDRIVGELRAEIAMLRSYEAEWELLLNDHEQQRDAALDRVAELEKQEPVAFTTPGMLEVAKQLPQTGRVGARCKRDRRWCVPLYAAPAAQAQQLHDLDKQCRDDVARALGLRPSQERGFAWSYLLASIKSCAKASEDAAQAQHSVPKEFIGRLSEFLAQRGATGKALLRELRALCAAAPGKEGV